MVDDDNSTLEGFSNGIRCLDVSGHVLVGRFRPPQRSIEGIENDGDGRLSPHGGADSRDKRSVVLDEIQRHWLKKERHTLDVFAIEMPLPECFDSRLDALLSLERAVNHRSLLHSPVAIFPSERNVHHQVECPERLAALWRTPDNY